MPRFCLLFIVVLLLALPVSAEEFSGLAMHGAPKYEATDTHVDYANPDAPKGGTLKQAAVGTFDTINPYSIKGNAAQGLNLVYDRLMARVWDEPFTMYPLIAERVDVPEDRSSLTVHINPKARFHDGSAITADDVVFSFETLRDSGRPNMRQVYKLAKSSEKIDDLTVKFSFGEGYNRETVMIFAMMPVLSKAWWQGRVFDSTTLDTPNLNGPYRIAEIDPGRKIVYERVPDYWAKDLLANKGLYNFDKIIYDYYRDELVAFEAFKSGALNLRRELSAGTWNKDYNFPALTDGRVIKDALEHHRPGKVEGFIFNTRRPPFDDIRVREALSYLFDFDWVNKNLFYGEYERLTSYFPNTPLAATDMPRADELKLLEPYKDILPPSVFGPAYIPPQGGDANRRENLRKADELLVAAGWAVKDGKRVNDKGEIFKLEIIVNGPEMEKIVGAFSRNLSRVGIEPQIRMLDSAAFIGRLQKYDFDMVLHFWISTLSPGTEQYLYWSCDSANVEGRWNYPGICEPAIDALSQSIADAGTREALVANARALDRALTHGIYMIPLYYNPRDYVAYWPPLAHPAAMPLYGTVLETWWMEEK